MDMTSPKFSQTLMNLTYLSGGVGLFIGFNTVSGDDPSLSVAALLAVGLSGLLSFLRHSVFHRSDAKRMGWDLGQRNNFQIEVGLANLAWGILATFAVVLDWGLRAEAASFLVFGFYMVGVGLMLATAPVAVTARPWKNVAVIGIFGATLVILGFQGMSA
jgi:hypothetical protein